LHHNSIGISDKKDILEVEIKHMQAITHDSQNELSKIEIFVLFYKQLIIFESVSFFYLF